MQLFIPRPVKPSGVANARTARSPQWLLSGGSRGIAMGPFHTALEKTERERCSHWLQVVIATGRATFFSNKTTSRDAADQPFFIFIVLA